MEQPSVHEASVGTAPGLEHDEIVRGGEGQASERSAPVRVTVIDYSPANAHVREMCDADEIEQYLAGHRPEWSAVRWINVDGITNLHVIHALATKYQLHPLAVEDLLHRRNRAKVETYGGEDTDLQARLFIVARMLELDNGRLTSDQISMFLGHKTLLTFQEEPGDVWNRIRQRIQTRGSRVRVSDASFLAYSLLDAIVDEFFPILEHYGDRMDELETIILDNPPRDTLDRIHQVKRDLLVLSSVAWPMRELVLSLQRDVQECISDATQLYLRDLHDHVIQVMEIVETFRERASDLTDSYMSRVSSRMNEIMKVLTIISTVFIPLTFLAGVYGMNFRHFPELDFGGAYPAFWIICITMAAVMLVLFRQKGWL